MNVYLFTEVFLLKVVTLVFPNVENLPKYVVRVMYGYVDQYVGPAEM